MGQSTCRKITLSHCLRVAESKPMICTAEQLTRHLMLDIICTTHTRTAVLSLTVYLLCIHLFFSD